MSTITNIVFLLLIFAKAAIAHQPVMNIGPDDEFGIGFQITQEYFGSSSLLKGEGEVENPNKLKTHINNTWYEGVLGFKGGNKLTFKLPYTQKSRVKDSSGGVLKQKNSGFADLELAYSFRYYRKLSGYHDYFAVTPLLRLPTGSDAGDLPLSDGSADVGLSLSYHGDSALFYHFFDLFFWKNNQGVRGMREGNEIGFDFNWGYRTFHHPVTNSGVFIMLDSKLRHNDSPNAATLTEAEGGSLALAGPALVFYKKNIIFRAEYNYPFYEKKYGSGIAHGDQINIKVGMVF